MSHDTDVVIHQAVASHAARQPRATALICGGYRVSYEILDAAAGTYARELAARGVGPGQVVPLLLPRSAQLVALQLAVLKCGAAYAGVDPRWPRERRRSILGQIGPAVVVSQSEEDGDACAVYRPPAEDPHAAAGRGGSFDAVLPSASEPATVFFTSGTTGVPKGVLAPHRAVTRLFGPGGLDGFGPGHATPQAAPLPWDMYAFELWGQLTAGGTVVLVDGDHLLPGTLRNLVRAAGVDTLWITTSLFNLFVDEDPECFGGLGHVLTGGEKLSPRHVRLFLERHPGIPLRNGYGPAENCMLTTTRLLRLADCDTPGGVPVGTPVPGTSVLILGPRDEPCPPGTPGEICIAGQGLAVGYLGAPELTRQKFPTVVAGGSAVRVYRTGDVGVVDDSGVLHFRGREDRQVKISGHRVELPEIEVAARKVSGVRDCVVLPLTGSDGQVSRLALFYTSDAGEAAGEHGDPLSLRRRLADTVPAYLVPGIVRWLPRFPLTANGKLDTEALRRLAQRPREAARKANVYPMTLEQEAMWLDDHLDDGPSRYLESWVYRLSGPVDPEAAQWALARVVDRHEALRSGLTIEGDRLVQIVRPGHDTRLSQRACTQDGLDAELRRTVSQPLDLNNAPLRGTLLRLGAEDFVLVVQFHHAVVDDWSLAILDREFGELYGARVQGREPDLPPLPFQLGPYAVAQREAGIDPVVLGYWQKSLRRVPGTNAPPPDRPRPALPSHRGGQLRFRIDGGTGQGVRRLARALRTTPFTIFAATLSALLWGYTGAGEVILGTPVSRRGAARLDGLIGCLTDLLPLCLDFSACQTFRDVVASTRTSVLEAMAHRDIPYGVLVTQAVSRRRLGPTPLCQTVLVVDDAPRVPLNLPGIRAERLYVHPGICKFDLFLTLVVDDDGYQGFLEYAEELYDRRTAERVAADFSAALAAALTGADRPLTEIVAREAQSRCQSA